MKITNILNLVEVNGDDFDTELGRIIENNTEYKKAKQEFYSAISKDTTWSYIDSIESPANVMETISRDIAFKEGFNTAVKMIFSALNN